LSNQEKGKNARHSDRKKNEQSKAEISSLLGKLFRRGRSGLEQKNVSGDPSLLRYAVSLLLRKAPPPESELTGMESEVSTRKGHERGGPGRSAWQVKKKEGEESPKSERPQNSILRKENRERARRRETSRLAEFNPFRASQSGGRR